ncbi:MAG: type II toxin-antitoxin system VapC family toxin [Anaerolineales bacterium]|nr:type II toxin-antitoxin system VapC family toxin [Anaerolineales bacterium]
MRIAVDTSAIIAVIADEPERARLIEITKGSTVVAPPSVKWEIGNAFSAMMKKARINLEQDIEAIEINLKDAMQLAGKYDIYAYDAYILQCAIEHNIPLITLDKKLAEIAKKAGVQVIEA